MMRDTPVMGGQSVVRTLKDLGTTRIFCVPGESYLPILDALHDEPTMELVTCRHEGGAAFMAEAAARLNGQPGICLVTRGPGATNASIGVHTAMQSSTPMILIVGQAPNESLGREAFQEIDLVAMFKPLAKWAEQISSPDRVEECLLRAWNIAISGRPGPVVLVAPVDVLFGLVSQPSVPARQTTRPAIGLPGERELESVRALLAASQRPLLLVGGPGWSQDVANRLRTWAEASSLPVVADFRCQDYLDHDSPSYVGELGAGPDPALVARLREADLILAIGTQIGEMATQGYVSLSVPHPEQRLIHVYPDPAMLGRVYQPDLGLVAGSGDFIRALAATGPMCGAWADWCGEARAGFLEWQKPPDVLAGLDLASTVRGMSDAAPQDTIVTNGAGNYTSWVQRWWRFHRFGSQLAPQNGAMGYGLPAAIAAKLTHPERTVVCFAGDGCFMMSAQELATAAHHGVALVVVVVNNGMYGTIRMHQERNFPGRVSGTSLTNPDLQLLGEAFGCSVITADTTKVAVAAFREALDRRDRTTLIELRTNANQLTPGLNLGS